MKKLFILGLIVLSVFAYSQDPPKEAKPIRKIRILHADPQLVALFLAGKITHQTPPELSTVQNTGKPR